MRHGSQCRSENYRTSRPVIVGVRYPSPLIPSVRTSTIHRLFLILCPRTEGRLEECHVNWVGTRPSVSSKNRRHSQWTVVLLRRFVSWCRTHYILLFVDKNGSSNKQPTHTDDYVRHEPTRVDLSSHVEISRRPSRPRQGRFYRNRSCRVGSTHPSRSRPRRSWPSKTGPQLNENEVSEGSLTPPTLPQKVLV